VFIRSGARNFNPLHIFGRLGPSHPREDAQSERELLKNKFFELAMDPLDTVFPTRLA
jgi:hypothetical protein